jgi:hypothetical protein
LAKQFPAMEPRHAAFIERQKIFFTATAAPTGRVNISPRETAAFRVLGRNEVCYLDRTGSGNETAAHVRSNGRMTIMFCAFEGAPLILRLYGTGETIAHGTQEYVRLRDRHFGGKEPVGARQIVRLDVDLVQTSCGFGVPFFDYVGERDALDKWAQAKGNEAIEAYRREKNRVSIDGFPTGILDDH